MSYIGTPPSNAFTSLLKQDFSTSATTGYTLDHAVNNANDIALFINFVRQEPTAAYAASGTTLTLTSATASSDDMYCVYLGQALQTVNPANASVGISQLSATGTKNSTTFLRGDNTFAEAGGGITELDFFRTNANTSVSGGTDTLITSWTRNTQGAKIGTGMSVSSGIWTFPSTGIYLITTELQYSSSADNRFIFTSIQKTSDNSSYTELAKGYANINHVSSTWYAAPSVNIIFDCTNTTNDKIKIYAKSENATVVSGGTDDFSLGRAVFTRIGDT